MGRYKFTPKDLEPLRPFLDLPLARDVVDAAVPVKRLARADVREELTLPVEVLSREHTEGVPLDAILAEVQKTTPTATGIVARGDKIVITHSRAPKPQERAQLEKLLTDPSALRTLKEPIVRVSAAKRKDVKAILLDESTPDAEWLQAFRRYAVDTLLKEQK
jgi:hypothetical protein